MNYKFPVYKPFFSGKEKDLVLECIDSTWISSKGKFINQFEDEFSNYLGVRHAVSVMNGTVALHLALEAIGVGPGDEVIVPTLTYIASVNAISYTGATPVFVDSEPDFWQMDPNDFVRKITSRTKAVMPVHLYGHPCDIEKIIEVAGSKSIHVVEDCAEALGTKYNDKFVGGFGDVSTFSFFGNKTITTGEGGMVVSNNLKYADLALRLKGQGLANDREYWHDIIGFNYRMTNICAAIGCAQMTSIDEVISKKRQIASWYKESLNNLPVVVHQEKKGMTHSYWMVSILTDKVSDRDPLRLWLKQNGVETRPVFSPVNTMPMYFEGGSFFPVASDLSSRGINLPSYPDLSRDDVSKICEYIETYFKQRV
jgi:perosamine synthetase